MHETMGLSAWDIRLVDLGQAINPRGRGGSRGGAWGAHAPPFGTEQALNAEVYHALNARSYSDTAHISI